MHAQEATGSSDELLEVLGATQSRPHNYMWLMHRFVPRKHPGSTSAANIRFLSSLIEKTDIIVKKSRPLSRSGAIWRQNTRVDATFSK